MSYFTRPGLIKLGQAIRTERERRGMSVRKLASLAGIAHTTVERLEAGLFENPTPKTLDKLAPHIYLTVEQMLAIASGASLPSLKKRTCEEILPLLAEMPMDELRKLAKVIEERLSAAENLENNFTEPD